MQEGTLSGEVRPFKGTTRGEREPRRRVRKDGRSFIRNAVRPDGGRLREGKQGEHDKNESGDTKDKDGRQQGGVESTDAGLHSRRVPLSPTGNQGHRRSTHGFRKRRRPQQRAHQNHAHKSSPTRVELSTMSGLLDHLKTP